jgi:nucleotide-binding universal stress UspA family protein
MKLKRVLVPVDFSRNSLEALEYAVALGKAFNPEFVLLFALEPLQFAVAGHAYGGAVPINVESLVTEQRRVARADLDDLQKRFARKNLKMRAILGSGTPYRVIVDTAKRLGADLIVMGTHGRTGLTRFFMGSVAEMVARHAHCPVLTVRGQHRRAKSAGRARAGR